MSAPLSRLGNQFMWIPCLALGFSLVACGGDNMSGSVITVNTSPNAKVYVYPVSDPLNAIDSAESKQGQAVFSQLPEGSYHFVARSSSNNQLGASLQSVQISQVGKSIALPLDTLVRVRVPKTALADSVFSYFPTNSTDSLAWSLLAERRSSQFLFRETNAKIELGELKLTDSTLELSFNSTQITLPRQYWDSLSTFEATDLGQSFPIVNINGMAIVQTNVSLTPPRLPAPYPNDDINLGATWGRLYSIQSYIDAASTLSIPSIPYACPKGLRAVNREDLESLIQYLGGPDKAGAKLKSTTGWPTPGNGLSGLNLLPAGMYNGVEHKEFSQSAWLSTVYTNEATDSVWVLRVPDQGPVEWLWLPTASTFTSFRCMK